MNALLIKLFNNAGLLRFTREELDAEIAAYSLDNTSVSL